MRRSTCAATQKASCLTATKTAAAPRPVLPALGRARLVTSCKASFAGKTAYVAPARHYTVAAKSRRGALQVVAFKADPRSYKEITVGASFFHPPAARQAMPLLALLHAHRMASLLSSLPAATLLALPPFSPQVCPRSHFLVRSVSA